MRSKINSATNSFTIRNGFSKVRLAWDEICMLCKLLQGQVKRVIIQCSRCLILQYPFDLQAQSLKLSGRKGKENSQSKKMLHNMGRQW